MGTTANNLVLTLFLLAGLCACSSSEERSTTSDTGSDLAVDATAEEADVGEPEPGPSEPDVGSENQPDSAPGDCGGSCEDDDPCTKDQCVDGACQNTVVKDMQCDDGDACTTGETCQTDGACAGGVAVDCPGAGPCALSSCEPQTGCVSLALEDGEACDDGDACTIGDSCEAGTCVGGEPLCPSSEDPCQTLACDEESAECLLDMASDGAPCDDDDACTEDDSCADGVCQSGPLANCDDGELCTADGCDEEVGCNSEPLSDELCDDGDLCTAGDACQGGDCVGTLVVCDDGVDCTMDSCAPLTGCVHEEVDTGCDDGGPCLAGDCDPSLGCILGFVDGGCDDGDPCTLDDSCFEGACVGGSLAPCDDGDPCTIDSCDLGQGCVHLPSNVGSCKEDVDPVVFELSLDNGNNLVSLPVLPSDQSLVNVLGDLEPYTIRVMGEARTAIKLDDGNWVGNMHTIERTEAFWITLDLPDSMPPPVILTVTGLPTDPDVLYPIHKGVNWLSYPTLLSQPIDDALPDNVDGLVESIIGEGIAAFLDAGEWVGSLTTFVAGRGYQVKFSEAPGSFAYSCPSCDGVTDYLYGCRDPQATNTDPVAEIGDGSCVYPVPAGWDMPLDVSYSLYLIEGLRADGQPLEPGDAVGAFSGGQGHGFGFADGDFVTVPVVGLVSGDPVDLVLFDASAGSETPLVATEPLTFQHGFTLFAGCTDPVAENYSTNAAISLEICELP